MCRLHAYPLSAPPNAANSWFKFHEDFAHKVQKPANWNHQFAKRYWKHQLAVVAN
jgi:hypothetical protein